MRGAQKITRPAKPRRAAPARGRLRLEVDERRAQLVDLGVEHFGAQPYDDVSIDVIAQAAGISKGLLYHYFPTKRAFYVACVRKAASQLLAMTETPDDVPPLERLTRGLDAYLAYVREHGRAYANLMRSGVGVDAEVASVVDETRAIFLERLTRGMEAAVNLSSPLIRIALHGYVGLAEAASLAWVESCVAAARPSYKGPPAPAAADVRNLLANALLAIVHAT